MGLTRRAHLFIEGGEGQGTRGEMNWGKNRGP